MEQFRKFLRDKAFALVLTACLLAAAAAGVWAVRTVRNELKQNLDAVRSPSSTAPGIDEGINTSPGVAGEEEAEWQQQNAPAANSVANVPKADSSSGGAASSSGARSGSGSVREPSALQTESLPASSSAAPASTQPVSGRVLNSYSGDELVYSKTLGDWRTHNGVDYAADRGGQGLVTRYPYGNVRMDHLLSKEQYFLYSIDNVLTLSNGHWKLYSKSDNTI